MWVSEPEAGRVTTLYGSAERYVTLLGAVSNVREADLRQQRRPTVRELTASTAAHRTAPKCMVCVVEQVKRDNGHSEVVERKGM